MKRSSDFERKQDIPADLVDANAQAAIEGETDWRRPQLRRAGDDRKWGKGA